MSIAATFLSICRNAGLFLVMCVLMLSIGEQFPFSNFPMYASLPESTMNLRVTDEEGGVIPVRTAFKVLSSALKKQIVREFNELKAEGKIKNTRLVPLEVSKECGGHVLDWMLETFPARQPDLVGRTVRLEQVLYAVENGSVTKRVDVLAEGVVPALKPRP